MSWLYCVMMLAIACRIEGAVETIGEIYHSGTPPSNFGDERRIFLLDKLVLKKSVITEINAYFDKKESVTFMVLREHPNKKGDYFTPYKKTVMPTLAKSNFTIVIPSDEEPWHVESTDKIGFLSSSVAPALLTKTMVGSSYMYSNDVDSEIASFMKGVWPWAWNFKVTYDTDTSAYPTPKPVVVPTYPPTTSSTGVPTSTTPSTTTTTTADGGDNNNNNNNNGGTTGDNSGGGKEPTTESNDVNGGDGNGPQTGALSNLGCSGFLCPLLNPIVVLVLLIWCGVLSLLCFVLCCCIQQRKRNEKKRKYYVDYLRRQNPYMESLHSKDYTWHDYSTNGENGSSGPGSHPEEAKSDTGIMNSMVTNENDGYSNPASYPHGGTITAADANL